MATVKVTVRTPSVPKTLTVDGPGRGLRIPVDEFSAEDLIEVGKDWTDALLEAAGKRRPKATGGPVPS